MTAHGRNRRRALVVGGSTGIGRGVADAWADVGLDVVVLSRSAPVGPGADRLRWVATDLTDAAQAAESLMLVAESSLHSVCYSAVHYGDRRALFKECSEAEWRRQVDVNLHGLWLTLSRTLPALRRGGTPGVFLGVSSEVVYNAGPGRSGYAASKAAAAALLDSISQEENTEAPGAEAVRVVQALPAGMVDTPGIRRRRPEGFDYSTYMRPASFAPLARELAATAGAGLHGAHLVVDGTGAWYPVSDKLPVSQSRRISSGTGS
ncbi:SDR family NAD(P)-dependent oxidoreductase [Streptomyces verrucosisporus]|uniref:SDR family NAD(P)-dependent oxidoreductase n=1 Tax=Streptomyces verrucosisporus TaxID=1695161 RepID=UPI0019D2446B|nr:SDR family NAD(P)-dependent oxidoreductase [Streptomyces verrucosisporus]MBN3932892.1 SDR family NAD(P)-dependent oxidoreductase [Streptomyces verrucosisporus]